MTGSKFHFRKITLRQGRRWSLVGRGLGSTLGNREKNMNMYLGHAGSGNLPEIVAV